MSIVLCIDNLQLASIQQNNNPPKGILPWFVSSCSQTKNFGDIAKLGRDFFSWVQETAKLQEYTRVADWAEAPIKICGQIATATLIPFFLSATYGLICHKSTDTYLDLTRKIALWVLSACLVGKLVLEIGVFSQYLSIAVISWYILDLLIQLKSFQSVAQLVESGNQIEQKPADTDKLKSETLEPLLQSQKTLSMLQVAKATASIAGVVLEKAFPAYYWMNATVGLGTSLLSVIALYRRETGTHRVVLNAVPVSVLKQE